MQWPRWQICRTNSLSQWKGILPYINPINTPRPAPWSSGRNTRLPSIFGWSTYVLLLSLTLQFTLGSGNYPSCQRGGQAQHILSQMLWSKAAFLRPTETATAPSSSLFFEVSSLQGVGDKSCPKLSNWNSVRKYPNKTDSWQGEFMKCLTCTVFVKKCSQVPQLPQMHCELFVQSHSLELPCYLFMLEHFLIYLPLIWVALFHRKQLKANESNLHVTLDLWSLY